MHEDEKTTEWMLYAGASAYISKVAPVDAIISMAIGEAVQANLPPADLPPS